MMTIKDEGCESSERLSRLRQAARLLALAALRIASRDDLERARSNQSDGAVHDARNTDQEPDSTAGPEQHAR